MTLEDLKEEGVLLPEREWGQHELSSTAPAAPFLGLILIAAATIIVALAGAGGPLTFIGIALFLIALGALTWLLDRAIREQLRRTGREREAARTRSST